MSFDLAVSAGDLVLKDGDLAVVNGQTKLVQDIIKICITAAGSNIFQPWYGSFISKSLIGSVLDTNITLDVAKNQLQNSLENLKKLQQLQLTDNLQAVSLDEHIGAIREINVTKSTLDPRAFEVVVRVISRSFKQTPINFTI